MKKQLHYCPICADVLGGYSEEERLQIAQMECGYCKGRLISTEEDVKFFAKYGYDNNIFYLDAVRELYAYPNPLFDKEKCDKRVALENAEQERMDQIHRELDAMRRSGSNVPKCPACGSTNVRHIGGGERAVSVIGLGLFSGKLGKNYECGSCKARW